MIYDKPIDILSLPTGTAIPTTTNLTTVSKHYCAELTVYHSRYWESVQAGSSVDRMVQIPERLDNVNASMYVRFMGGVYAVNQVQYALDSDGLDVTTLSLKRYLANLDGTGGSS